MLESKRRKRSRVYLKMGKDKGYKDTLISMEAIVYSPSNPSSPLHVIVSKTFFLHESKRIVTLILDKKSVINQLYTSSFFMGK